MLRVAIILILTLHIFGSCSPEIDKHVLSQIDITEIFNDGTDIPRRAQILKILNQIANHPTVDAQYIGIGSTQSTQFQRFIWLKTVATDEELIKMTNHNSGNVRAYSFKALCERNSIVCKSILERHLTDTTQIVTRAGCIGATEQINVFFLKCLSKELTEYQFEKYKAEISTYTKNINRIF